VLVFHHTVPLTIFSEVNPCCLTVWIYEELSTSHRKIILSFLFKSKLFHFVVIIGVELKHERHTEKFPTLFTHRMIKYAMKGVRLKRKIRGCQVMFISEWLELGGGKPSPICKLDLYRAFKLYLKTSHQSRHGTQLSSVITLTINLEVG
jgi:hypothetical protein